MGDHNDDGMPGTDSHGSRAMNTDTARAVPGNCIRLLDELESLLNEQVVTARRGDFSTLEELAEKSGRIVHELTQAGAPICSDLKERFERLVKSYRIVMLSAAAEKNHIEKQLHQIGQGRKTLRIYRTTG